MNSWQPQQTAPGSGSGSPLLAVNFLPVTYTAGKFPADMIPFESPEQLGELRAKLDGTHVVTRAGGQIACVPLSADSPAAGRRTELDVRDDRINFFVDLHSMRQVYYYAVRAVSPGIYHMGPVSADAMYNGEYHSYNGSGIVHVVE